MHTIGWSWHRITFCAGSRLALGTPWRKIDRSATFAVSDAPGGV